MKHRLLREWLKVLVIISIIEMVPTKGVMTPGTFTNFFDWTTEVTNFNMDFQAVGYSPFTTTNLDGMIVWTMSVIPAICSMNQNKMLGMEKALEKVVILVSICSIPVANAVPNIHADYDIVPGMKIVWDGIPINEFVEEFMRPLDMGLGQIVQDGFSLLSCIRGSDAAGYNPLTAQPQFAVANAQQRNQHNERNRRAFACIMNRIDPLSEPYHEIMTSFNNDGIGAYDFISQIGDLPFSPEQIKQFKAEWESMDIYTLEREKMLVINVKALFMLCAIIRKWARRLRKTKMEERAKFLAAIRVIPAMKNRVQNEEDTPKAGWNFRANYGAHYPAGIRGTPHAFAGQPDIYRMATGWNACWIEGIRDGSIKKTPRGFVNAAHVEAKIVADNVFIVKQSSVNNKTQCFLCGGFGHATVTILDDGSAAECATKALGIKVDKDFLSKITYPDGVPNRILGPAQRKPFKHHKKHAHLAKEQDEKSQSEDSSSSSQSDDSSEKSDSVDTKAALKALAMQTGKSADEMKKVLKHSSGKKYHKRRN